MSATDAQVDGDHYTSMKLQPLELTYLVGGTPCFCKLAKYGSRDKGDKLVNLNKALHCVSYEKEMNSRYYSNLHSNYPALNDSSQRELAYKLIEIFTEDPLLREALEHMYNKAYAYAIEAVELMIERENEQ